MMDLTQRKEVDTALFDCLARRQRRAAVAVLSASTGELAEEELAVRTAARVEDKAPAAVSEDEREQTHVALHHRDLPKLDSVDLVDHDVEAGRVELTDHPALEDPGIRQSFESPASDGSLDDLFAALTDERRRRILSFVREAHRPVGPRELSAFLAAREQTAGSGEVASAAVDRVQTELHHSHLPKLRDAGLLEYDEAAEAITYEGHPDLRSDWLETGTGHPPADA